MTSRRALAARARGIAGLAVAIGLWLPAALAGAARDPEKLPIQPGGSTDNGISASGGSTLLRMGVALLVVVAVIAAIWYVLKRVRTAKYPEMDSRGSGLIDVLATTPLGPNRNLHLVRVGDEIVVIGATEHSVNAVARFDGDGAEALTQDLSVPDARGAFTPSAGSRRPDARFRAPGYASDATVLDRLRALTTRK